MRPRLEADFRLRKRSVGRKVQRSAFLWLQCPNRTRAPNGSADAIEAQSFATEHFPNYSFSDADPGEWFANDDILGVRPPAWSPCSIATLPSELLAPESTAVQTFTQKVTVTLNYGQLLYLENALLVAKP